MIGCRLGFHPDRRNVGRIGNPSKYLTDAIPLRPTLGSPDGVPTCATYMPPGQLDWSWFVNFLTSDRFSGSVAMLTFSSGSLRRS